MKCRICGTRTGAPNWEARETYLWANQYGYAKRVFCEHCGAWTDQRVIHLSEDELPLITIVKEPTNPIYRTGKPE